MKTLIYVTHPTNTPLWREPSISNGQPHIVQLAAMVVDTSTNEMVMRDSWTIKPDGWLIPQGVLDDIGITEEGVSSGSYESLAINGFYLMWKNCDFRVAYGEPFHSRVIRIAFKRYMADGVVDAWKAGSEGAFCAMRNSTNILKIPQEVGRGKYKFPKLGEAYELFTGKAMPGKTSIDDRLDACMEIYLCLQDINA